MTGPLAIHQKQIPFVFFHPNTSIWRWIFLSLCKKQGQPFGCPIAMSLLPDDLAFHFAGDACCIGFIGIDVHTEQEFIGHTAPRSR